MLEVVVVDTSVLLNVLDVPGFNQDREEVFGQFEEFVDADASLLLPMATVFETGNHIADLPNGGQRRRYAGVFCDQVRKALNGEAPWALIPLPDSEQFSRWLEYFPDFAMREAGMSDLSIVKAWEAACARHRSQRVRIWSHHRHMQSYDRQP